MKKILLISIIIFSLLIGAPYADATRIHTTGFESQSATDENLTNASMVNPLEFSTSIKRTGRASAALSGTITSGSVNGSRYIFSPAVASTTLRFYIYITEYPDQTTAIAAFSNASHVNRSHLKLTTSGALQLFDATPSQVGSDSAALSLNRWYRVELKHYFVVSGAVSTLEAKIDGTVFATSDTAELTSTVAEYALGINLESGTATDGAWYFDDVALNNGAGSTQNGYPGEGRVANLYPNGAGDSTEGSSNGSGVGWNDMDDHPSDGDTTYWSLGSTNDTINVNLDNAATAGISTIDIITLVQTNMVIRNSQLAASTYTHQLRSKSGGTLSESGTVSINSSTWNLNDDGTGTDKSSRIISLTNPDTGESWTARQLDTVQIGARAPDASPAVLITSMWATVEYVFTPPAPSRFNLQGGRIKFTNGRFFIY